MNSVFILNFKEPYDQNYAIFLHLSGDGKLIWSDFSMTPFFPSEITSNLPLRFLELLE